MIKYIHLLWQNELKFNVSLVKLLNDVKSPFDIKEQLFCTPHLSVYEALSQFSNIEYNCKFGIKQSHKYVNYYSRGCDCLFLHSMCPVFESFQINPFYFHKLILRTWGHDIPSSKVERRGLNKYLYKIVTKIYSNQLKKFKLIGIANSIDLANIQGFVGSVPVLPMPYSLPESNLMIKDLVAKQHTKTGCLRIMVGHSGFINDNHIAIFNLLSKFKNESILIYCILSYGVKEYIETIKREGKRIFGSKIIFINTFLPFNSYLKLIREMDIGIFDGTGSYALGTINLFYHFKKKVFFNEKGIIRKGIDVEGYPYYITSDLLWMNIEDLSRPVNYSQEVINRLSERLDIDSFERWKDIYTFINS